MLQNDLYTIESLEKDEESAKAVLSLNALHSLFKGHFPGQPVLPGACMLQMIKELMELVTGNSLQLHKAYHIKFISLVDPSKDIRLKIQITYKTDEVMTVVSTIMKGENICLKFSGEFVRMKSFFNK